MTVAVLILARHTLNTYSWVTLSLAGHRPHDLATWQKGGAGITFAGQKRSLLQPLRGTEIDRYLIQQQT